MFKYAVSQVTGADVKFSEAVRCRDKIFNLVLFQDTNGNYCILQCIDTYKLYKNRGAKKMQRYFVIWRKYQNVIK